MKKRMFLITLLFILCCIFLFSQEDEYKDIPKGLTEIPEDIEPEVVAKLFFYLSSVEDNWDLWLELLSDDGFDIYKTKTGVTKRPRGRITSWWRNLTTKDRHYKILETLIDKPDLKKYSVFVQGGGENREKPMILIFENGRWKVDSALP